MLQKDRDLKITQSRLWNEKLRRKTNKPAMCVIEMQVLNPNSNLSWLDLSVCRRGDCSVTWNLCVMDSLFEGTKKKQINGDKINTNRHRFLFY